MRDGRCRLQLQRIREGGERGEREEVDGRGGAMKAA